MEPLGHNDCKFRRIYPSANSKEKTYDYKNASVKCVTVRLGN